MKGGIFAGHYSIKIDYPCDSILYNIEILPGFQTGSSKCQFDVLITKSMEP